MSPASWSEARENNSKDKSGPLQLTYVLLSLFARYLLHARIGSMRIDCVVQTTPGMAAQSVPGGDPDIDSLSSSPFAARIVDGTLMDNDESVGVSLNTSKQTQ